MNSENRKRTPEQEDLIRQMWQVGGKSASRIVSELATLDLGLTRNAVISLVHRRGWGGHGQTPVVPVGERKVSHRPRPQIALGASARRPSGASCLHRDNGFGQPGARFAPTPLPKPEKMRKHSVPIWDLKPHHCKWVMGEPTEFKYCGTARVDSKPYCQRHCGLAYQPRVVKLKQKGKAFSLPPGRVPNFY